MNGFIIITPLSPDPVEKVENGELCACCEMPLMYTHGRMVACVGCGGQALRVITEDVSHAIATGDYHD